MQTCEKCGAQMEKLVRRSAFFDVTSGTTASMDTTSSTPYVEARRLDGPEVCIETYVCPKCGNKKQTWE